MNNDVVKAFRAGFKKAIEEAMKLQYYQFCGDDLMLRKDLEKLGEE